MPPAERHDLALFIDFENIALGLRGRVDAHFDIQKVLQRLLEIGNVLVKRAYADWSRFGGYTRPFHEAAIELIEIPRRGDSGKNSADIRLCVDAMDLCYAKEHIDTFVILSGDSDFSPLVSKLRENGKRVIGLGLRGSTSNLLVSNCDEFIYYETLDKHIAPARAPSIQNVHDKESLLKLVTQTVAALLREGRDPIQASLIKDTIKRKQPSFNEAEYGFRSFTELLEEAQTRKLIEMREDPRSGTYLITLMTGHAPAAQRPAAAAPAQAAQPAQPKPPTQKPEATPITPPVEVKVTVAEAPKPALSDEKPAPAPVQPEPEKKAPEAEAKTIEAPQPARRRRAAKPTAPRKKPARRVQKKSGGKE